MDQIFIVIEQVLFPILIPPKLITIIVVIIIIIGYPNEEIEVRLIFKMKVTTTQRYLIF